MKKIILLITVLTILLFSVTSCGPKLLTADEVLQKVEESFDAQVEGLEEEFDQECEEKFDNLVVRLKDSLLLTMEETESK